MSDSATILRDGNEMHRIQITHRDWMLLSGPGFAEGPAFTKAIGIFENYTMAGGIPKGSLVRRRGQTLFDASTDLHAGIVRDYELLRHDYSCKVGDGRRHYGGGGNISVGGRTGILWLRPKGYCSIKFVGDAHPKLIDLRSCNDFVTDFGNIRIYRRKAETHWLEILPPLLKFLEPRLAKELTLEHIDRVL